MPGGFKYPSSSDIDPNVVDLLYRAIKPKLDSLIDDRQQRRQVWGPTFKQEGIRILPIADADYVIPAPEYGKRTLIFTGPLTAERRVELPALAGAWWIIRNDTAGAIKTVAGADGVTGPVIPIGESAAVYTDGHVVWTFPTVAVGGGGGGTGALPDGVDTELQARAGPTTFKRVTYSITSDQHVSLAGQFTVTLPPPNHTNNRIVIECTDFNPRMTFTNYRDAPDPIFIVLNKARGTSALPAVLQTDDWVGAIRFQGWTGAPAAWNTVGYLDVRWIDPQGAVTQLGAGAPGRALVQVTDNGTISSAGLYAAALPSGSHYYQVQTYGHVISGGTTGSIWYQDAPAGGSYYIALNINPATDNGKVLTVVETGPSTGVFLPRWMPPAGGAGGGAPGLPDWSLQFRQNATTFGGVTSSVVTGANIVLGGELAFHNVASTDQHIRISALGSDPAILMAKFSLPPGGPLFFIRRGRGTHALPEPIGAGDYIGAILFQGYDGADFTTHGYWRTGVDSAGSVTELGAGPYDQALVRITHNPLSASAAIVAGTGEWRVQTDGLITSFGLTGSMFYKAPGGPPAPPSVGYMWDLPIGLEGQILTVVESTHPTFGDYLHPAWTTAAAAGGVPDGDFHELQSRWDATTFKRVLNSEVTGASIKLAGDLAISDVVGHTLYFQQTAPVGSAQQVGLIWFREYLPVEGETVYGYVRAYREDVWVAGTKVVEVGQSAARRMYISDLAASLDYDGYFFHVRSDGLRISGGVQGAFFYQEGAPPTGPIYTPLAIGAANTYLRSDGVRPQWAVLPAGTVTSPGGSPTQLQFHQTGAIFGGITGSSTDGTNVWLTGFLNVNQQVVLNEAPCYVTFRGDAGATVYGFVRGFGSAGAGVMELGCSPAGTGPRVQVQQIGTVGLFAGDNFLSVHTDGTLMSIGARGALFHKGDLNYLVPLDIAGTAGAPVYLKGTGDLPFWAAIGWADITGVLPISKGGTGTGTPPTSGQLLIGKLDGSYNLHTLTPDTGIQITNGDDGTITIKCTISPGAGATPPGGSSTQLQYHAVDDTFGGITGSSVSGANIYLGGFLNVMQQVVLNEAPGYVTIRGDAGATVYGFVRGFGTAGNGVMELATGTPGTGPRVEVQQIGAVALIAGGNSFRVHTDGTLIGIGSRGSLYFKGDLNYLVPLDILGTVPAPVYLKATGDLPFWSGISAGDITGILPISKGGTGTGTAPGPGYLLIGKADGSYVPAILTEDTGILITEGDGTITIKCTITPGSGTTPPGGSSPQLQFNNGGVFGGVPGSYVADDNISLTGNLTFIHEDNLPIYINLHRWGNNLTHLDGEVALLNFYGLRSGSQVLTGFLRSYWDDYFGVAPSPIIEIGHSGTVAVRCSQGAAGLIAGAHYVIATTSGVRVSAGDSLQGAMFYQNIVSGATYVTALSAASSTNKWLRSDGSAPTWQTISAGSNVVISEVGGGIQISASGGPGGATPGGSQGQIQFNESSAFAGVGNYASASFEVAPASGAPNLVLAGGFFQIVPSISGTIPTRNPNQDQEFFISATMAAPTRFVMRRYSNQPNDSSSIDGRLGGYIRFDKGRGTAASPEDIANGDQMGQITWWGRTGGALAQMGHIVTYFNAGGVLRLAAKAGGYAFIDIREGTVPATDNSITLYTASQTHFFQVLNAGFRISIGTVGAIYYQSHTGSQTQLVELNSSSGAVGNVLTLVSGFATEAGSLVPRWQAPAGGPGGSPGTPVSSLQWNNASTFDGVENSTVTTGGLVTLGEQSNTLDNSVLTLQQAAAGNANLTNGHSAGKIRFQGQLSGMQDFGVIEGLYNTTPLKTLRMWQGSLAGAYRVIALKDSGEMGLEVSNGSQVSTLKVQGPGITLTPGSGAGTNYGTYVRDGSGYVVTVGPGAIGTYLRSSSVSTAPSWQTLSFGDFTSGTLPLLRGGTGSSLSAPSPGRILYYSGSTVTWLTVDSTLTVNTSTHVLSVTSPGGSSPGVLRGSKTLSDNTLTSLFTINYSSFDHKVVGGEVIMILIAKQVSGGSQTQVYKRKINFTSYHNGSGSSGAIDITENGAAAGGTTPPFGGQSGVVTTGQFNDIRHSAHASGSQPLATRITQSGFDSVTYSILVDSSLSFISQLTCFYIITWNGELDITAA